MCEQAWASAIRMGIDRKYHHETVEVQATEHKASSERNETLWIIVRGEIDAWKIEKFKESLDEPYRSRSYC